MKVQLVVVQGKPEGKIIPLLGPVFKIGRGDTCHLRPNSELVSREHAEFTVTADSVVVRDLGSRNGTIVNGKALTTTYQLKDRDLVQVGNLTFAVSIVGAPAIAAKAPTLEGVVQGTPAPAPAAAKKPSGSGVENELIDSWLVSEGGKPKPESPSGVYGGETVSINTVKTPPPAAKPTPPAAKPPASPSAPASAPASAGDDDEIYERLPEGEGDAEDEHDSGNETEDGTMIPEEFLDESNPFYAKKKTEAESKPVYKDTSDAASDILRKMMERRRRPS